MGLDISVGSIKYYIIDHEDGCVDCDSIDYQNQQKQYEAVIKIIKDEVKAQTGSFPEWSEEESDEYDESKVGIRVGSYTLLHYLRRYATYLDINNAPPEPCKECEPTQDQLLLDIYDGKKSTSFPHLIDHSDCNGYYIPCDFETPLWVDPLDYGVEQDEDLVEFLSVGSSTKLLQELLEINKHLGVDLNKTVTDIYEYAEDIEGTDYEVEKWCLCILYKMCLTSAKLKLPIIFS